MARQQDPPPGTERPDGPQGLEGAESGENGEAQPDERRGRTMDQQAADAERVQDIGVGSEDRRP